MSAHLDTVLVQSLQNFAPSFLLPDELIARQFMDQSGVQVFVLSPFVFRHNSEEFALYSGFLTLRDSKVLDVTYSRRQARSDSHPGVW